MIDQNQPSQPGWVAFDHKVPPVGVDPDDLDTPWTVCFNAAWLPYVLGALAALSRVEVWDTDDFDVRNTEALRAEHLLTMFMSECEVSSGVQTLVNISEDGCGIVVSYDNGETWIPINFTSCIADVVASGIDTAIANGVIPSSPVSPVEPNPEPETCKTYHVQMDASGIWKLPVSLSPGDTVHIFNERGAWTDGDLGIFSAYYCLTGKDDIFGACGGDRVSLYSDPNQAANHMELMLQVNDTYYLPLRELVTIGGEIIPLSDAILVPNYDRVPLGQGVGSFDIEICKGATTYWCKQWDFEDQTPANWEIIHGTPSSNGLAMESGFFYSEYCTAAEIYLTFENPIHLDELTIYFDVQSKGNSGSGLENEVALLFLTNGDVYNPYVTQQNLQVAEDQENTWTLSPYSYDNLRLYLICSRYTTANYPGAGHIKRVKIRGHLETNPFGESNC